MLYAERDKDGKIVSLTSVETPTATEIKYIDDEVIAFLDNNADFTHFRTLLSTSDSGLVRALEDLINILISKKIICFTDFPVPVQKKILARQKMRERMSSTNLIVEEIL